MVISPIPLFVCHANCARSVLAYYLYRHLSDDAEAVSAGLDPGQEINDRVLAMLRHWGIDASEHRPRRIDRTLCEGATAIFVMGPNYLHRLLHEHGADLASKTYLFADPFSRPLSFGKNAYKVCDPSFDHRPTTELVREYGWMRERVVEIRQALLGHGRPLICADDYLVLVREVDRLGH